MRTWVVFLLVGCGESWDAASLVEPYDGFLPDISVSSGIQDGNFDPNPPEGLVINDHSRLGFADLDGDGFDDIVMHSLFPNVQNGHPFTHVIMRNLGDGTFEDFSQASGLGSVHAGFFAFADFDNDGDQDLLGATDIGPTGHSIWLNDGSGRFTELPDAGVVSTNFAAAGAALSDFDGDGNVDIYLANGSTFLLAPDQIFWGLGDGRFEEGLLPGVTNQPGNGAVACDIDGDGDQDVLVSNYSTSTMNGHNQLWLNQGGRNFAEKASKWGFAALRSGNRWLDGYESQPDEDPSDWVGNNGFGIDCADIDGDGLLDVFHAAISHPNRGTHSREWSDPTTLLINTGDRFEDQTAAWGIPFNEGDIDAAIVDFDNDGLLDLSLTRDAKYEGSYERHAQKGWVGLLWQQADQSYKGLGKTAGINQDGAEFSPGRTTQNIAWSDIDRDGDQDVVIGQRAGSAGRPNRLHLNDVGQNNPWLSVDLVGDGSTISTDAFGARVVLSFADERQLLREKKSGRGTYNSMDDRRLHFGLGRYGLSFTAQVRWPDGTVIELPKSALKAWGSYRVTYPDQVERLTP